MCVTAAGLRLPARRGTPISPARREVCAVFKVKGINPSGRAMTFACGTDEQAMEKTWELQRRGFREVVVVDPQGRELAAAVFERSLGID